MPKIQKLNLYRHLALNKSMYGGNCQEFPAFSLLIIRHVANRGKDSHLEIHLLGKQVMKFYQESISNFTY